MGTVYVLDTNVLLQDPNAVYRFENNDVIIPAVVLEEIDSKKRYQDEIGRNARLVARILDGFRQRGALHRGVPLPSGGVLRVELNHRSFLRLQESFAETTNDNRILAVAVNLQEEEQAKPAPRPVILVSMDALLRIKADALGLYAEDFKSDKVIEDSEVYAGYTEITVHPALIDQFYLSRSLSITEATLQNRSFYPNQFVILTDDFGSNKSALARFNVVTKRLEALVFDGGAVWGIQARNAQQKMAFELLLNDEVPLVTMIGKAGTGKTLLSLATGLMKVEDERKYNKLVVARPIVPLGNDLGYLPGEKEEKLRPWMQPIYDNLEYLFQSKRPGDLENVLAGLGSIQVEALTYIRGRSIANQFILIDEAQNLTKHEVKTILSRVGEGSKIVLMGDPDQIDNPYLDATNNGLTYVVERLKAERLSGHIRLVKGERSALAQLVADQL